MDRTAEDIERFNQEAYAQTCGLYGIDHPSDPKGYFHQLVLAKLNLVAKHAQGKKILDLGCSRGDYLFELAGLIDRGYGIDYTDKAIEAAMFKKQQQQASHLHFLKANARQLPFHNGEFDLVYSFSTLAYIPQVQEVFFEAARVLKPRGKAVLDLGNRHSLNDIVCTYYRENPQTCHLTMKEIKTGLHRAGLGIIEWHSFGILPFWGERPGWLRPLLHPHWKKLFEKKIRGRMLDEWVSNFPLLKPWTFRQLVVCEKKAYEKNRSQSTMDST